MIIYKLIIQQFGISYLTVLRMDSAAWNWTTLLKLLLELVSSRDQVVASLIACVVFLLLSASYASSSSSSSLSPRTLSSHLENRLKFIIQFNEKL
ncbi:hypothetical protein RchiOBHm_Chr3g0484291 [Rosa chinensis]|uniref:Uncharacterized protein n=1 Tax=Rosa chinensis TaxID=74649 RepID=A0A2P6REP2_ROSCH|nr:hypothetical protein RchiOBHm_Chr3g0484291 [Rosa chinensis]